MQLRELNVLLRPYGISFECDNCEEAQAPLTRPFNIRTNTQVKRIQKKSFKSASKLQVREKKTISPRKCHTAKKPAKSALNYLDNSLICRSAQAPRSPVYTPPKHIDFFSEFKQSCDNFLNCPQFENLNTYEELKNPDFDYDTAAPSLEPSESTRTLRHPNLQGLKKDLFNQNGAESNYGEVVLENNFGLSCNKYENFELDFDQDLIFSEFFSFA